MRAGTYLAWIVVTFALSAPGVSAKESGWMSRFECGRKMGWSHAKTEKLPTGYRRVSREWNALEGGRTIQFVTRIETDLLGTVTKFSMEHRSEFGVRRISGARVGSSYRCRIKRLKEAETERTLETLFVDRVLYTRLLIDAGKATGTIKVKELDAFSFLVKEHEYRFERTPVGHIVRVDPERGGRVTLNSRGGFIRRTNRAEGVESIPAKDEREARDLSQRRPYSQTAALAWAGIAQAHVRVKRPSQSWSLSNECLQGKEERTIIGAHPQGVMVVIVFAPFRVPTDPKARAPLLPILGETFANHEPFRPAGPARYSTFAKRPAFEIPIRADTPLFDFRGSMWLVDGGVVVVAGPAGLGDRLAPLLAEAQASIQLKAPAPPKRKPGSVPGAGLRLQIPITWEPDGSGFAEPNETAGLKTVTLVLDPNKERGQVLEEIVANSKRRLLSARVRPPRDCRVGGRPARQVTIAGSIKLNGRTVPATISQTLVQDPTRPRGAVLLTFWSTPLFAAPTPEELFATCTWSKPWRNWSWTQVDEFGFKVEVPQAKRLKDRVMAKDESAAVVFEHLALNPGMTAAEFLEAYLGNHKKQYGALRSTPVSKVKMGGRDALTRECSLETPSGNLTHIRYLVVPFHAPSRNILVLTLFCDASYSKADRERMLRLKWAAPRLKRFRAPHAGLTIELPRFVVANKAQPRSFTCPLESFSLTVWRGRVDDPLQLLGLMGKGLEANNAITELKHGKRKLSGRLVHYRFLRFSNPQGALGTIVLLIAPDPDHPGWATMFSMATDPLLGGVPLLNRVLETVRWTKVRAKAD